MQADTGTFFFIHQEERLVRLPRSFSVLSRHQVFGVLHWLSQSSENFKNVSPNSTLALQKTSHHGIVVTERSIPRKVVPISTKNEHVKVHRMMLCSELALLMTQRSFATYFMTARERQAISAWFELRASAVLRKKNSVGGQFHCSSRSKSWCDL